MLHLATPRAGLYSFGFPQVVSSFGILAFPERAVLIDQQTGLAVEARRPRVQRYGKSVERILQPDLLAERVASLEQPLGRVVPQRLGDGIDQIVGRVGGHDPKRVEADRRYLLADSRIGSGWDHRTPVRGRALPHLRKYVVFDRDQPYRRFRRQIADRRDRHPADNKKAVERAVLNLRSGHARAQIVGRQVLLCEPGGSEHDAGIGNRPRRGLAQRDVLTPKIGEGLYRTVVADHQLEAFREQARDRTQALQWSGGGEDAGSRIGPADDVGLGYPGLDLPGGNHAEVVDRALRRLSHRN